MPNPFQKLFQRTSTQKQLKSKTIHGPFDSNDFPPLPTLPTNRRPLTSDGKSPISHPSVSHSAFFELLPFEVRQQILKFAFGERTLHIDLALVRPLKKEFYKEAWRRRHGRIPAEYAFDLTQPRSWKWRGSTCHCGSFPHELWDRPDIAPGAKYTKDTCLSGRGDCGAMKDTMNNLCSVGAMGWLLSCKRAYAEGIEVLYQTNTMRMYGPHVIQNLVTGLPLPRRLDLKQLSMHWDIGPHFNSQGIEAYPQITGVEALLTLFQSLPEIVPNVQKLHVSTTGWLWRTLQFGSLGQVEHALHREAQLLLKQIVEILRSLKHLVDFRLSLPLSIYGPWLQGQRGDLASLEYNEAWDIKRKYVYRFDTGYNDGWCSNGMWLMQGVPDIQPKQPIRA